MEKEQIHELPGAGIEGRFDYKWALGKCEE